MITENQIKIYQANTALLKRKWQNCLGKEGRLLQNTFKMFFWKTNWFKNQPVGNSDKFELKVKELLKEKSSVTIKMRLILAVNE